MALDAFGITLCSGQLRTEALNTQRMWGNGVGTLITALADVVESRGLRTLDLFTPHGAELRRWTVDDIRTHVSQGHPVVVQDCYRSLPGRGPAVFIGDHYILITGVLGNGTFLYNDEINPDCVGWDRAVLADRLLAAMDASDKHYAYAAFAVSL